MLTTLKKGPTPVQEPGVFDLLMECHARIRRFTSMASFLAHATPAAHAPEHGSPESAVRDTAAAVLRYFTVALPAHSADEDLSLAPRLLALPLAPDVAASVEQMKEQHPAIEALVQELVPAWRAVADDPLSLPDHASAMSPRVERLRGLWDAHLHLEETTVFPLGKARLSAAEQQEIVLEMRARRR